MVQAQASWPGAPHGEIDHHAAGDALQLGRRDGEDRVGRARRGVDLVVGDEVAVDDDGQWPGMANGRDAPDTSARSGSWLAMKTSDLTMRPTVVPTAAAACSAVRVLCAHSITAVCTPAAASASTTLRADAFIVPSRELAAISTQPLAGTA